MSNTLDMNEIQLEIPVWVHGKRKWVTGITRKTTFDDLIYALLAQADLLKSSESIAGFAIAECIQSSSESILTQRILKGRSKVIKIYKTWQFNQFPLTVLQLISTSSTMKYRPNIFRRFLSTKDSNDQVLFNNYQENFITLERQKRLLEYLDEQIRQAEKSPSPSSNIVVSLNDVTELLSSRSIEQEQLIEAPQLCNSIFNIQEHIDEKLCISQAIEQAISNELEHVLHSDTTVPTHLPSDNNHLVSVKNSIYRSREISRIQSKQMHDLDLSLREFEILLKTKYDEVKSLEQETTSNLRSMTSQLVHTSKHLHIDEHPMNYDTFDMTLNSMKEIDDDSGINSLTSEDSNHQSVAIIHSKHTTTAQLETLV